MATWKKLVQFNTGDTVTVATPTSNGHAATKSYVDNATTGIVWSRSGNVLSPDDTDDVVKLFKGLHLSGWYTHNLSFGSVHSSHAAGDTGAQIEVLLHATNSKAHGSFKFYTNSGDTRNLSLTLEESGSATFAGTINSGAITSTGNISSSGGNIDIAPTKKIFLDGGGDTYIQEDSANNILFQSTSAKFAGDVSLNGLTGASYDVSARNLVLGNASGNGGMSIVSGTSNTGYINFADGTSGDAMYRGYIYYTHGSGSNGILGFVNRDSGASKRMELFSDGNFKIHDGWLYVNNRVMGYSGDIRVGSNDGNEMLHLLAEGTAKIDTAGTTALTINSSQNATFTGTIVQQPPNNTDSHLHLDASGNGNASILIDAGTTGRHPYISFAHAGTQYWHVKSDPDNSQGFAIQRDSFGSVINIDTSGVIHYNSNQGSSVMWFKHQGTQNGAVYGTGSSFGLLDQGGNWFYKHTNDDQHQWFVEDSEKMSLNNAGKLIVTGEIQSGSTIVAGGSIRTDTSTNYALLTGYLGGLRVLSSRDDAAGIILQEKDGSHISTWYGETNGNYGFLDGAWGNWDIKKSKGGNLEVDIGGTLKTVVYNSFASALTVNNGIESVKNGSDSASAGSYLRVATASGTTNIWMWQLGASNQFDLWNYNAGGDNAWEKALTFTTTDLNATFAGTGSFTATSGSNAITPVLHLIKTNTGSGGDNAGAAIDFWAENADGGTNQLTSRIGGYAQSATGGSGFNGGLKFFTTIDGYNPVQALYLDHSQNATFAGDVTATVNFIISADSTGSDQRVKLGASGDLQLWHNATDSVVANFNTGKMYLWNYNDGDTVIGAYDNAEITVGDGLTTFDGKIRTNAIGVGGAAFANSHCKLSLEDNSASSTDFNADGSQLYIRGYNAAGEFSGIGYNWSGSDNHAPAVWTGVKCMAYDGHTKAEYIIATRDTTGNTNPTRRLTIGTDGVATFGGTVDINPSTTYHRIFSYFDGSYKSGWKFSDLNGGIHYDASTDDLILHSSYSTVGAIVFQTSSSNTTVLTLDGSQNATFTGTTIVDNSTEGIFRVKRSTRYSEIAQNSSGSVFTGHKADGNAGFQISSYASSFIKGGFLGVGTNSAQVQLDVHSSGAEVVATFAMADEGHAFIATRVGQVKDRASGLAFMVGATSNDGIGSSTTTAYIQSKVTEPQSGSLKGDLSFYTNSGQALGDPVFTLSDVGVAQFDSKTNYTRIFLANSGGAAGSIYAYGNTIGFLDQAGNWGYRITNAGSHLWKTSNADRMELNSSGRLIVTGDIEGAELYLSGWARFTGTDGCYWAVHDTHVRGVDNSTIKVQMGSNSTCNIALQGSSGLNGYVASIPNYIGFKDLGGSWSYRIHNDGSQIWYDNGETARMELHNTGDLDASRFRAKANTNYYVDPDGTNNLYALNVFAGLAMQNTSITGVKSITVSTASGWAAEFYQTATDQYGVGIHVGNGTSNHSAFEVQNSAESATYFEVNQKGQSSFNQSNGNVYGILAYHSSANTSQPAHIIYGNASGSTRAILKVHEEATRSNTATNIFEVTQSGSATELFTVRADGNANVPTSLSIGYNGTASEMLVVGKDLGNLTSYTGMVFGSNDYAHFFIGESSTSYGAMSYRANLNAFYTWNNSGGTAYYKTWAVGNFLKIGSTSTNSTAATGSQPMDDQDMPALQLSCSGFSLPDGSVDYENESDDYMFIYAKDTKLYLRRGNGTPVVIGST